MYSSATQQCSRKVSQALRAIDAPCAPVRAMGTDNERKKPFNYRAAQCVLHCNNCITLVLALALLINGLITINDVSKEQVLKFTLCSQLQQVAKIQSNDLLHLHSNKTSSESSSKVVSGLAALCRPSGEDGNSGHCNPWRHEDKNRHADCADGYYCDEDFVCWDCDYVMPSRDAQGNTIEAHPCDAFDANDPKYDRYSEQQWNRLGPCARCMSQETNPDRLRNNSHTVMESVAAPDGADFLGWPSEISIGFGIVVLISSIFGFLGDAFKRRTLLFVHHFVLLLLGIAMIYAVATCFVFKQYAHDMLRTYWPWIKFNLGAEIQLHDAQELISERLGTVAVLCAMTTMSLWSGVVASGRLLGLRLLAKQMLVMTNGLTLIFSLALSITAFVAYLSGYEATTVIVTLLLGLLSSLVGLIGFIGAATERAGFLRAQMCVTAPLVALLFVGAFEALFWDKAGLLQKAKALTGSLGKMAPNAAVDMLEVHFVFVGLMALMVMVLIVLNLCCTRVLLQRLSVDGRYYERVSVVDDDLDDDYATSNDHVSSSTRRRGAQDVHNLEMQSFAIDEEEGARENATSRGKPVAINDSDSRP